MGWKPWPSLITASFVITACSSPLARSTIVTLSPAPGSTISASSIRDPSNALLPELTPENAHHLSIETPDLSVEELITILEFSDPQSSSYSPGSAQYEEFSSVLQRLAAQVEETNSAAAMIGYALTFPRQDSYLAAKTLITLGPEIAATDMPLLQQTLRDSRREVRLYTVIVFGIIGHPASCAVGHIGPHLWDPDPQVRSAVVAALESITGQDLIADRYSISPNPSWLDALPLDTPEGSLSGPARNWWTEGGSAINWHPSYGLCDP